MKHPGIRFAMIIEELFSLLFWWQGIDIFFKAQTVMHQIAAVQFMTVAAVMSTAPFIVWAILGIIENQPKDSEEIIDLVNPVKKKDKKDGCPRCYSDAFETRTGWCQECLTYVTQPQDKNVDKDGYVDGKYVLDEEETKRLKGLSI